MAAGTTYSRTGKDLMVLETPLLKVSRPVAACSRCRAAKIKCDGKLPACSACEKNGKSAECASANDNFARGKERSYVSTLETRVEKLERRIREAQDRKSSCASMTEDQENVQSRINHNASEPPIDDRAVQKRARLREKRDIDDLVSDFGFLTVNATTRDYFGFAAFMSYARLILSACTKTQLPPEVGITTPLPPRNMATITIQHYLDNMYTLLPFFDEASLYYSIDAVYKANSDPTAFATPYDQWSVRMVLAISNAWLAEQRGDQHYMEALGHVSAALVHSEQVLRPGAISTIQALLFLAEYALIDPHHFDSWSLIGAASRVMIDLGLHQDPPKGTAMSKSTLDLRRRVFFCVYMLDRSTSIVQTRAFSFSDDSTHVSFPSTNRPPVQPPSANQKWLKSFGPSRDLIKLRQIQSIWYYDLFQSSREVWRQPYPYLWKTCQTMATWFTNVSHTPSATGRAFFELELLYSYVYVLAANPRVPKPAPYAQSLVFEYCIRYAELMAQVINNQGHPAPVTFYDAMRVYMTGRQFLDILISNEDRLLSGIIPDPPQVPEGSAPAPILSNTPKDTYTNIERSINCFGQLCDSLGYFGVRWGYMSWRDNFERVTGPTVIALNHRLRGMQQSSPPQENDYGRPSNISHSSSGSVPTFNALGLQRPYVHTPPQDLYSPVLLDSSQRTPQQPQHYLQPQTYPASYNIGQPPMMQTHTSPSLPHQNSFEHPSQQFASWQGLNSYDQNQIQSQAQPDASYKLDPQKSHGGHGRHTSGI